MGIKYFAYGSNMAPEVMDALCPDCIFVGPARLDDYRLAFTRRSVRSGTGVADVVAATGKVVWGALYEVSENDLARIDRKEGAGSAYQRIPVEVLLPDGTHVQAVTYTVLNREPEEIRPAPDYLYGLINAAHRRALPPDYLDALDSLPARLQVHVP